MLIEIEGQEDAKEEVGVLSLGKSCGHPGAKVVLLSVNGSSVRTLMRVEPDKTIVVSDAVMKELGFSVRHVTC